MSIKISLVTDELSSDLETAIEIGNTMGIKNFELRGIESYRVGQLPSYIEDLCLKLTTLKNYDFNPIALSPGIFKEEVDIKPIPEKYSVLRWQYKSLFNKKVNNMKNMDKYLNEILPNSISLANKLSVDKLIIFGVGRPNKYKGEIPNYVYNYLKEAAKIAKEHSKTLLIENEHICFADTGKNTAKILNKVGAENLRVNWDPANAFCAGEVPYPDGYEYVKDFIDHVHFKDVIKKDNDFIYSIKGQIDWEGQINRLKEDNYNGYISIETHCRPKVKSVEKSIERLRSILTNIN